MSWIGNVSNIKSKKGIRNAINYILREDKITKVGYLNNSIDNCYVFSSIPICDLKDSADIIGESWKMIRKLYGKDSKILAHHFVQSFDPKHNISPEKAFSIAKELAEKIFGVAGYDYIIATHIDNEVIHNHILVNNVNTNDGKKYPHNKKTYKKMRKYNIDICKHSGIDAVDTGINYIGKDIQEQMKIEQCSKGKRKNYTKTDAYKKANSVESNLITTIKKDIEETINRSKNWDDFINQLKELGYEVKNKTKGGEDRKYVTYKPSGAGSGKRDDSLGEQYSKREIQKRIELTLNRKTENPEDGPAAYAPAEEEAGYLDSGEKLHPEDANKIVLTKRKEVNKKYNISETEFARSDWIPRNYQKKNLIRMGRLEQSYMLQYINYKENIINYESIFPKNKRGDMVSEIEYKKAVKSIKNSMDMVCLVRKYNISSVKDAKNVKVKLQEREMENGKKIRDFKSKLETCEYIILLFEEKKKYEGLMGDNRTEYQGESKVILENYEMIERELQNLKSDSKSKNHFLMMKDKLEKELVSIHKEIRMVERDKRNVNAFLKTHFQEKQR